MESEDRGKLLDRIGAEISPGRGNRSLSMPEQHLVEIACALRRGARIVIMDEPQNPPKGFPLPKGSPVVRRRPGIAQERSESSIFSATAGGNFPMGRPSRYWRRRNASAQPEYD